MSNDYRMRTMRGYDFFEVASSMQKAIRRGDTRLAGYFALELFASGYYNYVWKRLLTISAEDCYGIITQEIKALYDSFLLINNVKSDKCKGRIFISKAVILLCLANKSRDADHLQNLVYDKSMDIKVAEIEKYFEEANKEEIPEYAYDVHTRKGKQNGKSKLDFFKDEFDALNPRQSGIFDDLVNKL